MLHWLFLHTMSLLTAFLCDFKYLFQISLSDGVANACGITIHMFKIKLPINLNHFSWTFLGTKILERNTSSNLSLMKFNVFRSRIHISSYQEMSNIFQTRNRFHFWTSIRRLILLGKQQKKKRAHTVKVCRDNLAYLPYGKQLRPYLPAVQIKCGVCLMPFDNQ